MPFVFDLRTPKVVQAPTHAQNRFENFLAAAGVIVLGHRDRPFVRRVIIVDAPRFSSRRQIRVDVIEIGESDVDSPVAIDVETPADGG